MFFELGLDQGKGELRADERNVPLAGEQERDRTDVVLMPVGEDDRLDVVQPPVEVGEVGEDEIDPRVVVLGEEDPTVDDEQPTGRLEDGHVADLPKPTESDNPQRPRRQRWWEGQLGMGMTQRIPD